MNISDSEEASARTILKFFFGTEAESWPINGKVIQCLSEMMQRNSTCTTVMDILPRHGLVLNLADFRRMLKDIAQRLTSGSHSYATCKAAINYGWKSKVYLASQGI